MPRAASLAAKITDVFQDEPELIEGQNGIFDVVANGTVVFSKHQQGRFPEAEEIITALRALQR